MNSDRVSIPSQDSNTDLETVIQPTAIIDPSVEIGKGVEIGHFSIIGKNVKIGNHCKIGPYVQVKQNTTLGEHNKIFHACCIGEYPQDITARNINGNIVIGNHNTFREFCTVHIPANPDGKTMIGDNNFFMVNTHIAHDCKVDNNIIIANNTALGGHVEVHSHVFLSASIGVHQYSRIGSFSMIGAVSKVAQDVPPFVTALGTVAEIHGLNIVGMKRGGLKPEETRAIKHAFKILYHKNNAIKNAVEEIEKTILNDLEPSGLPYKRLDYLINFVRSSQRGIIAPVRAGAVSQVFS